MLIDLESAEKFVNCGVHCNLVYIMPKNVEEVRAHLIKQGSRSADDIEKRVNQVKNELESLNSKTFIERSFQSGDKEKLFENMTEFLKSKYTKAIFK